MQGGCGRIVESWTLDSAVFLLEGFLLLSVCKTLKKRLATSRDCDVQS